MEMTMTNNYYYIKRLIFSFLAVALVAIPTSVFAAMPDPIKKDMLETGKKFISKDAYGVMGLRGAEMALLLTDCSPDQGILSREHLRSV